MRLFNYLRVLGAFVDGYQMVTLPAAPKDRQELRMLNDAKALIAKRWEARELALEALRAKGEEVDMAKEKADFFPQEGDGTITIRQQYLHDNMVKRVAALQNNASIHNPDDVKELLSVFEMYGIALHREFKNFVFERISWAAKAKQKPKLLVHGSLDDEPCCIRFEAGNELCQKFLHFILNAEPTPGDVLYIRVEAEDPAIRRNREAGTNKMEVGKFVNHNLEVRYKGKSYNGKGGSFKQKPTLELLETMYKQADMVLTGKQYRR